MSQLKQEQQEQAECSEEEEEEMLVYAELEENLNVHNYRSIHVLGADQRNPILQLDDNFFKGKYEHTLGTYMFFEEDPSARTADPLFCRLPEKNLKYVCKSSKLITTNQAYLSPKEGMEEDYLKKLQLPEEQIALEEFTTMAEALNKFESAFKEPKAADTLTNS